MRLKIAVLAPMPRASEAIAAIVNPGLFLRTRDGVADILEKVFDQPRAARVAALFLDLVQPAELDARAPARLRLAHPCLHVVGDLALDMIAKLGVELRFHAAPPDQSPPPAHGASPSADFRMKPMASVSRRQLSASLAMCARPFRVSL